MAKPVILKKAVRPAPHVAPLRDQKAGDPTVRTYRALTTLLLGDNTEVGKHYRQYGDFVPEAETWRNIGTYLKNQQIEICFVNQSEIDAWKTAYDKRCALEDSATEKQRALEREEAEAYAKLAEIQRRKAESQEVKADMFVPDKPQVQKIDFGEVKFDPSSVREVPQQRNVRENRARPTTVRRKKV